MDPELLVQDSDGVAVVTLNRPTARNALNLALRTRIYEVMSDLDANDAVNAIVLTGTDPAFCAGLDLKELAEAPESLGIGSGDSNRLQGPLPAMTTPVIGAINGVAITGGFELALACDFLVASSEARFADTHARVGIMPAWGLTVRLVAAVGVRRAREMSATGNFVDAHTAHGWGLVNHVVAHHELLAFAQQLAQDIAGNDSGAVEFILDTYEAQADLSESDALALELRRSAEWLRSNGTAEIEQRRRSVTERGRTQI